MMMEVNELPLKRGRGRPQKNANNTGKSQDDDGKEYTQTGNARKSTAEVSNCGCDCEGKFVKLKLDFDALSERFFELAKAVTVLTATKDEKYYQRLTEKHLNGKQLYIRNVGVSDVTTENEPT